MSTTARVAALFVITRDVDHQRELSDSESLELLIENSADAYGFPPYYFIEPLLRMHHGGDLARAEREIIASAFAGRPAWLIGSRSMDWADHIGSYIDGAQAIALAVSQDSDEPSEDGEAVIIDLSVDASPTVGLEEGARKLAGREE